VGVEFGVRKESYLDIVVVGDRSRSSCAKTDGHSLPHDNGERSLLRHSERNLGTFFLSQSPVRRTNTLQLVPDPGTRLPLSSLVPSPETDVILCAGSHRVYERVNTLPVLLP